MADDYHKPEHLKLADELLADLNADELATKANALTGGCMRGEDALKLCRMVVLAALHSPGTEVICAGFAASVVEGTLNVYMHGEVASRDVPSAESQLSTLTPQPL